MTRTITVLVMRFERCQPQRQYPWVRCYESTVAVLRAEILHADDPMKLGCPGHPRAYSAPSGEDSQDTSGLRQVAGSPALPASPRGGCRCLDRRWPPAPMEWVPSTEVLSSRRAMQCSSHGNHMQLFEHIAVQYSGQSQNSPCHRSKSLGFSLISQHEMRHCWRTVRIYLTYHRPHERPKFPERWYQHRHQASWAETTAAREHPTSMHRYASRWQSAHREGEAVCGRDLQRTRQHPCQILSAVRQEVHTTNIVPAS